MDVFLDTMLADTERLKTLIENLLSASQLEQRALRLQLQRSNFSEFVGGYFRQHQFSLPRAGRMELDIETEIFVRIEPEAMETVFRNLVENALLYSEGPPQIRVSLQRRDGKALLTVTDRGRGLDPKELKKVFRMFYRVRTASKTIRGSGLGLSIVRSILRLHNGRVWMESAGPGMGATVCILLPLATAEKGEGK